MTIIESLINTKTQSRAKRGISLNRLLLLVATGVGLTVIALPSYRLYAFNTHRQMVQNLMGEITERQQDWAQNHHQFTNLLDLGYPGTTIYIGTDGIPQATASAQSIYAISLSTATADVNHCGQLTGDGDAANYVIVAIPIISQASDTLCGTLCLDQMGQRGASGSRTAAACW